jgi:hypothetical protein
VQEVLGRRVPALIVAAEAGQDDVVVGVDAARLNPVHGGVVVRSRQARHQGRDPHRPVAPEASATIAKQDALA